jgi:hypothetical protein
MSNAAVDQARARKVARALRLNILSLGAGVQSTTMALMAAAGLILPMPDCAIFADTQAEPAHVYRHLEWLRTVLPFPVYDVTAGNLEGLVASERPIGKFLRVDIPAFVRNDDGRVAIINRSCTRDFKIVPIRRRVRELLGIVGKRSPTSPICSQWIGISADEAQRMKPSREAWWESRWPLIALGMSRGDCLRWIKENAYPRPQKSACVFCPFHSDAEWASLAPEEFARAVAVDRRLRDRPPGEYRTKGQLYLHRSCVPLEVVDLSPGVEDDRPSLFGNECEGMCGV